MAVVKQAVMLAVATLVVLAASASAETQTAPAGTHVTGAAITEAMAPLDESDAVAPLDKVVAMATDSSSSKVAVDDAAAQVDPTAVLDADAEANADDDVDAVVDGVSRHSRGHGQGHGHGHGHGGHYKRRWCKHYKVCHKYRVVRYKPCHYYSYRQLQASAEAAAVAEPEEAAPMETDGVETADGEVLKGAAERSYGGHHGKHYGNHYGEHYGKHYGKHYWHHKFYCYKVRCHYKRKCYRYHY